jgi:DUF4097 and DUF4098 domain-containing protein YvlB
MRRITLFPLLCFSFALAGCDLENLDGDGSNRVQTDFHYSFPLNAGGSLNVDTFNGSIEIIGWDQNSVDISGTKYAHSQDLLDAVKIDTIHNASSITGHAIRPYDTRGNMGAKFIIHAPRKVNLDRIVSSNGKIEVRSVTGTENLRTSNGHIDAEQVDGPIDASTSNGRITVVAELSGARAPIHVRTSNGPIEVTAEHSINSDLHASTSNGSITVHLPASLSARLRATTSNAPITSDFEVTTTGQIEKHHLEGSINEPRSESPMIDLSTSNGHIRLAKL